MYKGDRLIVDTAGGGGWGDPKQRDRELVAVTARYADVRDLVFPVAVVLVVPEPAGSK